MCKDVPMDDQKSKRIDPAEFVNTPVDIRPDLSMYGIEEYDRGICEDNYRNRTVLRKQKLAWMPIYDNNGHATGQIEVLSQAMQEGRALASLNQRKGLLKDPQDANSDYRTGLDLMYDPHADELVPPWIMNATRDYYRIEEARDEAQADPLKTGKKIRPNLVSYPGRCRYVKSDGIRCMLWHAGRAADDGFCRTHLGVVNPEAGVGAVERARHKAMTMAPAMVDVLEEMALYATSEPTRVQAANSLLDRSGVRQGVDVNVEGTVEVRPAADIIRERLGRLSKSTEVQEELTAKVLGHEHDSDIVEAEIVTDKDADE
jgi:hypothetical protein